MCREGTWCDALMVQAVANAYNLRINIVESGDGFSELTVVECQHSGFETRRSIVLGHVDEYHYVSTIPLDFCGSNGRDNECQRVTFVDEENADIMHPIDGQSIHDESMRKTTSCKKTSESPGRSSSLIGHKNIFVANQEEGVQTLLELVR
ncbi:hypothetical protein ACROYT_G023410 [Oculina patagonica]